LNINDTYRYELKSALEQEKQAVTSPEDLMKKLTAVHFILAEMCGNRLFEGMINTIISLTHRIIRSQLEDLLALHGVGEHDNIVQAVVDGNAEAARRAMTAHGQAFGNAFMRLEKQNNMPGPEHTRELLQINV
jgi:DNA-binding GntR family transcriptional regulator